NWPRCTSGSDEECYDKQQRPLTYPSGHIDQAFYVTQSGYSLSPGYLVNPKPEEISVGSMACYDLPHLDSIGNINYYDQLLVYLATPHDLKVKYRALSSPPTKLPCQEYLSPEKFPRKDDPNWKSYVR